jgi:hypothetical protein
LRYLRKETASRAEVRRKRVEGSGTAVDADGGVIFGDDNACVPGNRVDGDGVENDIHNTARRLAV